MRAARVLRVVGVIAAIAGARWAVAAPFHADPAVQVIDVAVGGSGSGSGSGSIVLRNDGTSDVVATSIAAAPGCSAAVRATPLTGFTLAPGAMRALAISCAPSPPGMQRCTFQVRAAGNAVLLELEAVCAYGEAPGLGTSVAALDLGAVPVGDTASRTITLSNTGAAPIDRLFFQTTDLAGTFAVAAPCNPDARECDAAVSPIAGNATTQIAVTCSPRAPGPRTAELHITTSAGTQLAAPIALACTGLAATTPVIAVSPASVDLGAVELVNATAATTLHITNAGTGTLQLLDVQIVDSGTGAALDWSYTASAPCMPTIPASCALVEGASVDLDLAFNPSAIGVRDATLLVNYHDSADRSTSIPLHAIGRGATLELVGGPVTLDFGTLPLDVTATLAVKVVNRGTRSLTDATAVISPASAELTAMPAPMFTVTPSAATTITVSCTPSAAGMLTAQLRLAAPDVETNELVIPVRCAGDPAMTLTATPAAILLGEVRIATRAMTQLAIASVGGPIALTSVALETPDARLALSNLPAMTPGTVDLTIAPDLEGALDNQLIITPVGPPLRVAITGTAVAAKYAVPAALSLGTFCVQQPTTPRTLALASTGSATLGVSAPALQRADSPFDLAFVAPLSFPAELPPLARAQLTITPKRQTVAGTVLDTLLWTTDADAATAQTTLTATFVDNGPAVAPTSLTFQPTTIHLDNGKAQQVTLRNCSVSPLELDPPQIPAPFAIDSPSFPNALRPGETVTFSVGFHPTKVGLVTKDLVITSPQLRDTTFVVALTGEGISDGGGSGSGSVDVVRDDTSFYACGSCATDDASGALAVTLAALVAVVPRRRRATLRRP